MDNVDFRTYFYIYFSWAFGHFLFLFEFSYVDVVNADTFKIYLKMEPLYYKKMDFEEFSAAAISTYQLEALEEWEGIASEAFEYFEQEGNKVISVEELALVCAFFVFPGNGVFLLVKFHFRPP